MFAQYDEYQRLLRYKNGCYAFYLINILLFINQLITYIGEIKWAQDSFIEYLVIIMIPIMFMNIRNTWQGSHFDRKEKPSVVNVLNLLLGLTYFWLALNRKQPLIEDGLVTLQVSQLVLGLVWISTPITYFIKYFRDSIVSE